MVLRSLRFELWRARDAIRDWLRGSAHRRDIFASTYRGNLWGGTESVSGPGSSAAATSAIRHAMPELFRELGVRTLLDAPCGDFSWMQHVVHSLDAYVGVDIVSELIDENQRRYGSQTVQFLCRDVVADQLPDADAILCRDCFIHLPTRLIRLALKNFASTDARFLLLTNDRGAIYHDIPVGSLRPIDFTLPPFAFPPPMRTIGETGSAVRQLCVWEVASLPIRG